MHDLQAHAKIRVDLVPSPTRIKLQVSWFTSPVKEDQLAVYDEKTADDNKEKRPDEPATR